MAFKYSLQCDTLPWVGYNVLAEPDVVIQAAAEAGYTGIDLPGNPYVPEGVVTSGTGTRPDLVVLLKGLLSFLQETERTVDQSREFYEAGGWWN